MLLETTLFIAQDHPAFAGHFPGTPMVPGVVLLDAVIHALLLTGRPRANGDGAAPTPVCQISAAKFLSPVGPGESGPSRANASSMTPAASVEIAKVTERQCVLENMLAHAITARVRIERYEPE